MRALAFAASALFLSALSVLPCAAQVDTTAPGVADRALNAPRRDAAYTAPDSVPAQVLAGRATRGAGLITGYHEAWIPLSALNEGLGPAPTTPNLQTPQAAVEHFARAGRSGDFLDAARVLNLNLLPEAEQARRAADYAERLYYVLDNQTGFDWESLPDRPDGANAEPASSDAPLAGQPRRSFRLGVLPLDGRDVAIRLQRVRVGDEAPVWVFSPQTAENIPALYRRYGPGPIDRHVPEWAKVEVVGQTALWAWLALLVGIGVAALIALGVRRLVRRLLSHSDATWSSLLGERVATPAATTVALLLLYLLATALLSLPGIATTLLLALLIFSVIWLVMRAVGALAEWATEQSRSDDLATLSTGEKTEQQRRLTYLSVGRRVAILVVVLIGIGVLFSQFQSLEALGISMIASASVGAVLLGIAAQPVLGNLLAGLQIALAKPVRIGDRIEFEGDWGYVEDITFTFLLVRTWDDRRLVIPLRYFVTHPFENWTMRDAHLVKPVVLHADYTVDVDALRAHFAQILKADDAYDGESDPKVEVVGAGEETLKVRCLCSAADPSTAWALQCRMREQMAAYLARVQGGRSLPRQRVVSTHGATPADTDPSAGLTPDDSA